MIKTTYDNETGGYENECYCDRCMDYLPDTFVRIEKECFCSRCMKKFNIEILTIDDYLKKGE